MEKDPEAGDLDSVLKEIGELGRFQVRNFILLAIPIMLSTSYGLSYVLTSTPMEYRCVWSQPARASNLRSTVGMFQMQNCRVWLINGRSDLWTAVAAARDSI